MYKLVQKIDSVFYYLFKYWYFKIIFGAFGVKTRIRKGLRLEHPENIFIGKHVSVGRQSWLAASPFNAGTPRLEIGDGCNIGGYNQIYSTTSIILEKNVLTADRVYISDSYHDHQNIALPVMHQPVLSGGNIVIGEGSWIGINVCIIGASVGKNCVIGANSVVLRNIPDYCIAVGAPARIVKRFNKEKGIWAKTDAAGKFV